MRDTLSSKSGGPGRPETHRPPLAELDQVVGALLEARTLILATHVNPDGDALGSAAALGLALRRLGKEARIVLGAEPPEKLRELFPPGLFEIFLGEAAAEGLGRADLCVLLDTSEPERAGVFQKVFFQPGQRRACVDHHPCPRPGRFAPEMIVTAAPATGDLVLAILDALGVPLDPDIARALWVAIASDTGWFRFENAGAWALEDAARLAAVGLRLPELYRALYEEYPASRSRLLGHVLTGLRTELQGAFVWSALSLEAITGEGLGAPDLDGMVDHLKAVRGAKVAALIAETGPGSYKISLRAPGDGIEVESIARRFGGGGHLKAAGCRFSGTLEALIAALSEAVREKLA